MRARKTLSLLSTFPKKKGLPKKDILLKIWKISQQELELRCLKIDFISIKFN
jgi:hypothetical protein